MAKMKVEWDNVTMVNVLNCGKTFFIFVWYFLTEIAVARLTKATPYKKNGLN